MKETKTAELLQRFNHNDVQGIIRLKKRGGAMRGKIIRTVQKKADTKKQKIDASISSRVASLTIDEIIKMLRRKR